MKTDAGLYNAYLLADHYAWPIDVVMDMTCEAFEGHIAFLKVQKDGGP